MRIIFCRQFQFMANLKQFGSWIVDALNTKFLKFLIIPASYLTKTENRTKNSLTQLS